MVIYYIDMVILDIDMGYGLMIWKMTVSIWSSSISIWDILPHSAYLLLGGFQEEHGLASVSGFHQEDAGLRLAWMEGH
jgi:hypothetical protein